MARFRIEVPHEAEAVACARVVEIFLKTGSHLAVTWPNPRMSVRPGGRN